MSRLKANAVTQPIKSFDTGENPAILSDQMIWLGTLPSLAKNVFRLVEVLDHRGKTFQIQRRLKRLLWKPVNQWVRRMEDRTVP